MVYRNINTRILNSISRIISKTMLSAVKNYAYFMKIAPSVLLGIGRDGVSEYGTSNDHMV